ncbi:NADH-quinone oxidoreductase subunit NuoE [Dietzia lutea]|uniref:NADH-quinone oxidoreductase subunit E n=2 Tax=Dietzia lutea TaxID=546160 RepID=A0A2S1R4J3_9ACTN|nr:NADH-quinone oxidoreductase subunit NuoE [Dietzia lutea]AWH91181.1 NADH-quinone oxidoreductase subunit E [Dietzia lutea]
MSSTERTDSPPPANRGEAVFLQFGQQPDEPGAIVRPDARRTYPDDVLERLRADADLIVARYPQARSALLPLLHLVQAEDGHLTPAGIEFCALVVDLSPAEVMAVATFYSMYRRTPTGDYLVGVCTNTLCAVMGGDEIYADLRDHLGLDGPGTTDDGRITLERIECNAACDYAPVVMINWEFFDDQTPDSARRVVDDLRAGRPVTPTRGAPLCTFRETARILAGFPDPRPGANDGAPGEATLAGLRVARSRDMRAAEPPAAASASAPAPDSSTAPDEES